MHTETTNKIKWRLRSLLSGLFICYSFVFVFNSCEPDTSMEELKTAENYFPLVIGKYIVYSVDSIRYHEVAPTDTSYYEVKEILVDTFYDNESRLNYKIERYSRTSDTADWNLVNVWSVLYTDNQLQKIENNLRFIKLVAPLRNDISWEGNIYLGGLDDIPVDEDCNNLSYLEDWNYSYKNVDQPYTVNGNEFLKTITVIQEGDSNLIWFDYAEEVYAEFVGLVQKDFYHYYTQDLSCPECPWVERVQCGYSVKMKVLEWGG
ncbi:MAG: hypothetical protein IPI31_12645 [Bacteroidetes bacterium]|nr:hypothetical protein [Bacteroidota bacterium]